MKSVFLFVALSLYPISKFLESLKSGMNVPIVALPRRPSSISNKGSAFDQPIFIQLTTNFQHYIFRISEPPRFLVDNFFSVWI